jgi:hypothetical protein
MLDQLAKLWREKGHLTNSIINDAPGVPCGLTYVARFGSLRAAYDKIGFKPNRRYPPETAKVAISRAVETVAALIVAKIAELGGTASFEPKTRVISIAPSFKMTIGWARYVREETRPHRWVARVNRRVGSDLTLIVRMDMGNTNIQDYYLIATCELAGMNGRLRIPGSAFARATRLDSLDRLFSGHGGTSVMAS